MMEQGAALEPIESLWQEAEALIAGLDRHWNLYAEIRSSRSYAIYLQQRYDAALELVEPLYAEVLDRDEADEKTQTHIMNYLASYYEAAGEIQAGYEIRQQVTELSRRLEGEDSRNFAINLSNGISLEYNLGKFDSAERSARKAIDILNEVFEAASGILGVTYGRLALAKAYAGQFDEATESLEAMIRTFAHTLGLDSDHWEMTPLYRGIKLGLLRQWNEALPLLDQARDKYPRVHHTIVHATSIEGLLATALCRHGRIEDGREILARLESTDRGPFAGNPVQRAQLHEATATCLLNAGYTEAALDQIMRSLEAVSYPGRAMEIADRRILQARMLFALGQTGEAMDALDQAELAYLQSGLEDHPHFHHIESARRELSGE